jgi:AcrR family transcriptional regulator
MRHKSVIAEPPEAENPMRGRILGAAFHAFMEDGYADTSTLDIATRARVSKRDLYAHFGSKQEMLVACIKSRADRMRLPPDLPEPQTRQMLAATLSAFATNLVRETSDPDVMATFRLAISEATRSPEIARTLDTAGRGTARAALAALLANAQSAGLIAPGNPEEMAMQYFGLLWEGLQVGLLLGVAKRPGPAEAERRAAKATDAFMRLYPDPGIGERSRHAPSPRRRRG